VQVTHYAIVRDAENWSFGIGVNGQYFPGFFHAGQMLYRSGDAAGNIELWSYRGSGLPDLMVVVYKTGIYCGPGCANFGSQHLGQLVNEVKFLFGPDAGASGNYYVSLF
jgi:hypothetical protein